MCCEIGLASDGRLIGESVVTTGNLIGSHVR